MSDIIDDKEKFKKGWHGGLPETPCGSGSRIINTRAQCKWIPEMVNKYNIKTIGNVGAGDLNWWGEMNLPEVEVDHMDLIVRREEVREFDLVKEVPPKYDMIMCLWVLNHLPYEAHEQAFNNLVASGTQYLMLTDRPIWHDIQPPVTLSYEPIERLNLNTGKGDEIHLIKLYE